MRRIVLAAVLLCGLAVALGGGLLYYHWFYAPLPTGRQPMTIEIEAGQSLRAVAARLANRGILAYPQDLDWLARLRGVSGKIKAGEYRLKPGITANGLLSLLISGRVVRHALTIVEGWTFKRMLGALAADRNIRHTLKNVRGKALMTRLGHPRQRPEGRFFPDTYRFPRGMSDVAFLQRAYRAMQRRLKAAWRKRAPNLPFETPYEALILASIVEKETALPKERPRIAGVFVRRLRRGMRLQADPTVIYGLGKQYHGDITAQDLKRDTPYNTYTRGGLPPTPICLPSLVSIRAVMHPAAGNALYFVAKGDGSHYFSATLKQHDRAVRKYLLRDQQPSRH
jgi:UPF0755 protein